MSKRALPAYVPPSVWSLEADGVRDLLGPAESQYQTIVTASNCLPVLVGGTVQDNWQIDIPAGARARVSVDVVTGNNGCQTDCSVAPNPAAGPLDPKVAIYPPSTTPSTGPFNGYQSTADCGIAITGDTGCLGSVTRDTTQDCMVCDNINCTEATTAPGTCSAFSVTFPTGGPWTISVAAQAPSLVPQSEGCYVLTVESESGHGLGLLTLVNDDHTVTFFR